MRFKKKKDRCTIGSYGQKGPQLGRIRVRPKGTNQIFPESISVSLSLKRIY